ncbi:IS110 family transposase [Micromonospora cremea]|uniref:Transposase n=1 Tax=Micromonospora cremea TaxID=709881 RepID=A0A1N5TCY0_9ACTN|nr:IS110 family transposase [Micromonospora cremea]SIM45915.1 Transposase [Micromonospora cremea]SIM86878.1 Transposase [Micromonospora cremea]SIN36735.1 Transposase [Micromonospora cremea]
MPGNEGVVHVEEITEEPVQVVARVCAIDIGKAGLVACVRVPHDTRPDRRVQEIREYMTVTPALLELADWLRVERVELVAMEATSDYWKPVFYLLEAEGFECWLLNAKHVKNVPGRPKTDRLDAVWLAKVVERGMCRPSLVHPKPIRQLRDVTRYRRSLVREQTREKQRLEKTLEDAQIKLDSVISDLHGVSGRQMMQAMIDGQRDPKVLAEMAHGSMRRKIPQLREALTGHFDDHHAFICATMLRRIDALAADIANLDARIEELIAPFAAVVEKLDEVTGIGVQSAQEIIAEIGVNITVFPTAAHLVSWAKFSPIDAQSAGRKKANSTGKGNPWLAATLGEVVAGLSRTSTFLGDRYRRLARRRGKKRAVVAVGNSVLTIVWHLLTDPDARYQDLGPGFHESRIRKQRRQRDLIRQLEQLTGQKVDLQPLPQPAIA